jgi:hypothetical protein
MRLLGAIACRRNSIEGFVERMAASLRACEPAMPECCVKDSMASSQCLQLDKTDLVELIQQKHDYAAAEHPCPDFLGSRQLPTRLSL